MSISPWLSFFGGLIIGGLIGLFMGRKNYESCRDQLAKMTAELQARKAELGAIEGKIDDLHEALESAPEPPAPAAETTPEQPIAAVEAVAEEAAVEAELEEAVASAPAEEAGAERSAEGVEEAAGEAEVAPGPEETLPAAVEAAPAARLAAIAAEAEASEAKETPPAAATAEAQPESESETTVSHCPQKLARIHGIGRVYEDKLYRAGIGTFWQVATAPNEKLAEIFDLKDFQAVDLDAIKTDARRLAEETGTVGHVWSGQEPDDFESLPGIGKTYEARLYDAGVCTFEKLAAMSEEELAAIVKAPKWNQPDYAAWIAFAQAQVQKNA